MVEPGLLTIESSFQNIEDQALASPVRVKVDKDMTFREKDHLHEPGKRELRRKRRACVL